MPKRLDLVGKRFNRLEVVSFNRIENKKTYWNCLCDCGTKTIVQGSHLISGHTISCGCAKLFDLVGKTFDHLTVVSFNRRENKITYWECICDCGIETIVQGSNLISGATKSCGCLRKEIMQERCGSNNPNWLGGISFEPYCPLWTKELRQRIRSFFNNECVICGKTTEENKKKLHCHHITYDKNACCDGKPIHFAALCNSCHSKTNGNSENRARWEAILHRIIDEIYDGKSYYIKEEYKNLQSKTILTNMNK